MQDKRVQSFLRRKEEKYPNKINRLITASKVRLVGENIEQGIYSLQDALRMSEEQELDLVEISPNADPPVCRITDYKKFLYEKKKRDKELKSNAKKQEMKEIRFTPNTDDHDFEFKSKHAEGFLKEGNKVRAYVQFKGRAIVFRERGEVLLLKFAQRLEEVGVPDTLPKMEGKKMFITLAPRAKK
ncbi:MAG: translation initiation factor IF-3 [Fimbriimonadaceae bacterium]|nr:translation initiation factor IF-3 [Chitinophagales bacterium]